MKNIIKILAVITAAVLCASVLAACGSGSKEDKSSVSDSPAVETTGKKDAPAVSGESVSKTFSWVKFDVPAGYTAAEEGNYIAVINENDKNIEINVARDVLLSPTQSIDEIVEQQISNNSEKYSNGGDVGFGDRMWKMVKYQDNGAENRIFFALAGDGTNYLRVSTFGLTESDGDVKNVLASLTVL